MAAAAPPFSPAQYERYRRHLILPELGPAGQRALLDARVLLIGAGGLGCPAAQYLAAAGVGTLGLVDPDVVDTSNLQRQILYGTADVGRPKVEVARDRIRAQNPDVDVHLHPVRLEAGNALEIFDGYELVVDGTDNFPTRYLANDACVMRGLPNVHGSIFRFEGQMTVFDARQGPCYRCLYPEPPPPGSVPSCAEGGVLGVLPGIVAMVQATEAIKHIAGIGDSLVGRLLQFSALEMRFTEFRLQKDPACPVCGNEPSVTELIDYDGFCGIPKTEEGTPVEERSPAEVHAMQERGERFLLLDVRTPEEYETARLEGTTLIPLQELPGRLAELEDWRDGTVVVHCHHGGRSAAACDLLRQQGFSVINMSGGIEGWSLTVDARIPRY